MERGKDEFEFIGSDKRVPVYFIAIASNATVRIEAPSGSVLTDQSDTLLAEKDQETAWRAKQVVEHEKTISSLEEAVKWREGQINDLKDQINGLKDGLEWTQTRVSDLEKTIKSQEQALAWRGQQVGDLQTAKEYWEGQSKLLTMQLQNTQQQLSIASDTLAGIYASRGWKLIMKLRGIRDAFKRSR